MDYHYIDVEMDFSINTILKEENTPQHFHTCAEFYFVVEGEIEATIDGETQLLKAGQACYTPEFFLHSYRPISPESIVYIFLCPKRLSDRILEKFEKKQPPKFFSFDDFELLKNMLHWYDLQFTDANTKACLLEGCIQILYASIAAKKPFVAQKMETHGSLVVEILKYTNENYIEPLSLEDLSRRFGYSREHISRTLHKHLSVSWSSFVSKIRAQQAHNLLVKNPNMNILDAAYACGFTSPNTFYRAYQMEFGHPPRNYTKTN